MSFVKAFSCQKGIFGSSPAPVWSGKQQGYKHCLGRALGTPGLGGRRARAGTVQDWGRRVAASALATQAPPEKPPPAPRAKGVKC